MFLTFSSLIFSAAFRSMCIVAKKDTMGSYSLLYKLVNFYIQKWTAIFKNTLIVALIEAAPEHVETFNILAEI